MSGCREPEPVEVMTVHDAEDVNTLAVLETSQGALTMQFFPDKAPEHVRNFLTLCQNGYYDGTYFHRVVPDFIIQGGDPLTRDEDPSNDGSGGHSYRGPDTFLEEEINDLHHRRGIVSMARSQDPDSAGSQFFIMVLDHSSLDGNYTAFGEVIEGMDVVDRIARQPGDPIAGSGGVNPFEHQYVNQCRVETRQER